MKPLAHKLVFQGLIQGPEERTAVLTKSTLPLQEVWKQFSLPHEQ